MFVFCRFLPPPRNFMIQVVWEKIAILRWVGQNPGRVWGPTPVNVFFSITTRFHFLLNTFQVAVYYNFRFDVFLFLEGRIRRIWHRYREKVSLVLAAFVNIIHFLIRWKRKKKKKKHVFSEYQSAANRRLGPGENIIDWRFECHIRCFRHL